MTGSRELPPANAAHVIDELFASLAKGDVAGARACCTPDARVWHSFDGVALNVDQACSGWASFVALFPEQSVEDVRRTAIPGGFMQQHFLIVRRADGRRCGWPICIVVQVNNGRISRLEEYIDRSGTLPVGEGEWATPGLASSLTVNAGDEKGG